MRTLTRIALAVALAGASLPAEARIAGVPAFHRAYVANGIAQTQRRNNAAIAHVRRSIAATRAKRF